MENKILHIGDENWLTKINNTISIDFMNSKSFDSLPDLLKKIVADYAENSNVNYTIFINSELILSQSSASYRQYCLGLKILKHIRLSRSYKNLQFANIIVYSAFSLEALLEKSADNILLKSKGVKYININKIRLYGDLSNDLLSIISTPRIVSKIEDYKDFVIFTSKDFQGTIHELRGEIGRKRWLEEVKGNALKSYELDIKTKKINLLIPNKSNSKKDHVDIPKFSNVLLIDDDGELWKECFSRVFDNCEIDVLTTPESAYNIFNTIKVKNKNLFNKYKELLIQERNDSKIFIDDNQINKFYDQYREIFKYDLILLDIRLKKDDYLDDKLDSLVIYDKIRNISKSIPVIFITASFDLELHNKISKLENTSYWIKGAHSKSDFEKILNDIVQIKKTIEIELENKKTRNTSILQVEFLVKFIKLRENLRCHTIVDKEFGEKFKFDTDDGRRFLTILDNFLLSIISIHKSIESSQDIRDEIDKLWISTLRVFNYMIAQTDNFANSKIAIFNEFTNNKQTKFHILNKANFDKLNDKRNFYAHRKLNDKPAADNESIMYIDFVLSWFFRQTSNFM